MNCSKYEVSVCNSQFSVTVANRENIKEKSTKPIPSLQLYLKEINPCFTEWGILKQISPFFEVLLCQHYTFTHRP